MWVNNVDSTLQLSKKCQKTQIPDPSILFLQSHLSSNNNTVAIYAPLPPSVSLPPPPSQFPPLGFQRVPTPNDSRSHPATKRLSQLQSQHLNAQMHRVSTQSLVSRDQNTLHPQYICAEAARRLAALLFIIVCASAWRGRAVFGCPNSSPHIPRGSRKTSAFGLGEMER